MSKKLPFVTTTMVPDVESSKNQHIVFSNVNSPSHHYNVLCLRYSEWHLEFFFTIINVNFIMFDSSLIITANLCLCKTY